MKISVAGASAAGLGLAHRLGELGLGKETTLYEEHKEIGRPLRCSGIVSRRLEKLVPFELPTLQFIDGAEIFCGAESFKIKRKKVARSIDRRKFDLLLKKEAEEKGAKIIHKRVEDVSSLPGFVVDCTGPESQFARKMGQEFRLLPSLQYEVEKETELVEVYLDDKAPDFFTWVIPSGKFSKVGLAGKNLSELNDFVKKRFPGEKILSRQSGLIVISGPVKKTVFGNTALLGDSAGQVKATTGGGLVMNQTAAKVLAECIVEEDISLYEKRWRKKLEKELVLSRRIRKFINKASKKLLFELARDNKEIIEEKGDMDFHSSLASCIMKRPKNLILLSKLFFSDFF